MHQGVAPSKAQLSRGFKALKVWWSLRHYGRRAYAGLIECMADLAVYVRIRARRQEGL